MSVAVNQPFVSLAANRYPRVGTSITELLVALSLLAVAAVGVSQLRMRSSEGLEHRALYSRMNWELSNAREIVGTWQPSQITKEAIEQLPFSAGIAAWLPDSRWEANVARVAEPTAAIQIQLALHGTLHDQAIHPISITFWVEAMPEAVQP